MRTCLKPEFSMTPSFGIAFNCLASLSFYKKYKLIYIREGRSTPGAIQENDTIHFEWKQIDFIGE